MSSSEYDDWLAYAYKVALNSEDPSTQNGAVLLDSEGKLIGIGVNNFPVGVNKDYWHGDKEAKYARVVHAETSAILDAARLGFKTQDSTLVCQWAACSNCSKHIAAAGVKRLVRHEFSNNGVTTGSHWYEDCKVGDEIMLEAGVEILELPPVKSDIQLRRNGSLWSPGASN